MSCPTPLRSSRLALVLSVACALVAFPGAASASRAPSDAELGGITVAAVADCGVHQSNCVVAGALVSEVDDEYAWVSAKGDTGDYEALLSSPGAGAADWTVLLVQNQGTPRSCDDYSEFDVPAQVLNDLEIQGLKAGSATPVTCGTPAAQPKDCADLNVGKLRYGVSILRTTCSKARALVKTAQKHAKAPTGWAWLKSTPTACSRVLVQKKYRSAVYPLVDVPKTKPVIFVADLTTPACTADDQDGAAAPATLAG